MTRLYTRTGDDGTTMLFDGSRVPKNNERIEAYASVDELNSCLGWAAAAIKDPELLGRIRLVQGDLFVIGSELATPHGGTKPQKVPPLDEQLIQRIESWIDEAWGPLPELKDFVLPGGHEAASRMHLVRTLCRRAERRVVGLAGREKVSALAVPYLNRLGDLLFAWARWLNHQADVEEPLWPPQK